MQAVKTEWSSLGALTPFYFTFLMALPHFEFSESMLTVLRQLVSFSSTVISHVLHDSHIYSSQMCQWLLYSYPAICLTNLWPQVCSPPAPLRGHWLPYKCTRPRQTGWACGSQACTRPDCWTCGSVGRLWWESCFSSRALLAESRNGRKNTKYAERLNNKVWEHWKQQTGTYIGYEWVTSVKYEWTMVQNNPNVP